MQYHYNVKVGFFAILYMQEEKIAFIYSSFPQELLENNNQIKIETVAIFSRDWLFGTSL